MSDQAFGFVNGPAGATLGLEGAARALATAISSIDDAVFVIGPRPRTIVACNAAAERMFGYAAEQMIGRDTRFLHVDQASYEEFGRRSGEALAHSASFRTPFRMRRKDGSLFETLHTVTLLESRQGLQGGAVSVVRDASDLARLTKALEEAGQRFLHAQKVQLTGRLVNTVAHDFRNYLTVVGGNAALLLEQGLSPGQRLRVEEIRAAVERAGSLTGRLLSFVRGPRVGVAPVDLAEAIRDFSPLLRSLIGEKAALDLRLEVGLCPVRLHPTEVEQVLLNLAVNARDAMPGGGRLTIAAEQRRLDEGEVARRPGLSPGAYVQLSVADTGTGMPEETRRRALDPYFTTKEEGRGAGLGLPAVKQIAEECGGGLWIESEPGRGTSVRILLPCADAEAERGGATAASAAELVRGESEALLVVDDDAGVRRLMEVLLEREGYRVSVAASFDEALHVARAEPRPFELLIADVAIRGGGAVTLSRRLASEGRVLRTLLLSGALAEGGATRELAPREVDSLSKPFSSAALLRAVRRALDRSPQT